MTGKSILYLGDTSLSTAASYLAGVMNLAGLPFDYIPSDERLGMDVLNRHYAAVIISDYMASQFSAGQLDAIADRVCDGMGLLMIGGWESFSGTEPDYLSSPLSEVLPVILANCDDRVNCSSPCLVKKVSAHEIVDDLPFERHVPSVGGFNRFQAKPMATVVLESQQMKVCMENGHFRMELLDQRDPLLVVGSHGSGRVAAFASDVAPHWVGGFVDWGNERVVGTASGASTVEVGNWYAGFFTQLVKWTANL
jgi:uncharacterized membrane protein